MGSSKKIGLSQEMGLIDTPPLSHQVLLANGFEGRKPIVSLGKR